MILKVEPEHVDKFLEILHKEDEKLVAQNTALDKEIEQLQSNSKTDTRDKQIELMKRQTELMRRMVNIQNFVFLFNSVKAMNYSVIDLENAILKLPNRAEFDEVKGQVGMHETKIKDTLEPIKKLYEEYEEREKRGEEIYE
jgi:hypothetical protein